MEPAPRILRLALVVALLAVTVWGETRIPLEPLPLSTSGGVTVRPVMVNEIPEVSVDLIAVPGGAVHAEAAHHKAAVVWLVLDGQGVMHAKDRQYRVAGETIARAPQGWDWRIQAANGSTLHLLRIRRTLTDADLGELQKYPRFQATPHVKRFQDCPAYGEAIKSAKTVSRTLLPENYVPRMAMGTVETTGPDAVAPHSHPMLEQLFLGLRGNDITVTADDAKANLKGFQILHIPLGSNHGAQVAAGKKLHYVWMDFFQTREGQEWLKMHKPLEEKKP